MYLEHSTIQLKRSNSANRSRVVALCYYRDATPRRNPHHWLTLIVCELCIFASVMLDCASKSFDNNCRQSINILCNRQLSALIHFTNKSAFILSTSNNERSIGVWFIHNNKQTIISF